LRFVGTLSVQLFTIKLEASGQGKFFAYFVARIMIKRSRSTIFGTKNLIYDYLHSDYFVFSPPSACTGLVPVLILGNPALFMG
jgi:hypothetical protein